MLTFEKITISEQMMQLFVVLKREKTQFLGKNERDMTFVLLRLADIADIVFKSE